MKTLAITLAAIALASTASACNSDSSNDTKVTPRMSQNSAGMETPPVESKNLIQVAEAAGSFKTLLAALDVADLRGALEGEGPFTVFAPTDEAFAKIPADTLNGLLADKPALSNVLLYHVVAGKLMASDVLSRTSLTPLFTGDMLRLSVRDDGLFVSGAKVIATDVQASNGVIHIIDSVMLPGR